MKKEKQIQSINQHIDKIMRKISQLWDNRNKYQIIYLDKVILLLVMGLIIFGLINLFSASMYLQTKEPLSEIIKQIVSIVLGVILGTIVFFVPTKLFKKVESLILFNSVILALLIFTYVYGTISGGARSWIYPFGISFQPSELFKIMSMITLSWLIEHVNREFILSKENLNLNRKFYILGAILVGNIGLILIQPDFGMFAIILVSLLLLLSIHKWSRNQNILLYSVIIVGVILTPLIAGPFSEALISSNQHILERIGIFMNPFVDKSGVGYQMVNGYIALSRGGWKGVGLGNGMMKRGLLPAVENDFIIANIVEENGFLTFIILLLAYWCLYFTIFKRAAECRDGFRSRVISGMGILLFVQTTVNIAGVLGMIPMTGVTLPLISAGGTSITMTLICFSLILKMIHEEKYETLQKGVRKDDNGNY